MSTESINSEGEALVLRAGLRLKSQIDSTEVVVLKAGEPGDVIFCGGQPMISLEQIADTSLTASLKQEEAPALGKRLISAGGPGRLQTEVLVIRSGTHELSSRGARMTIKDAQQLPSSD